MRVARESVVLRGSLWLCRPAQAQLAEEVRGGLSAKRGIVIARDGKEMLWLLVQYIATCPAKALLVEEQPGV